MTLWATAARFASSLCDSPSRLWASFSALLAVPEVTLAMLDR